MTTLPVPGSLLKEKERKQQQHRESQKLSGSTRGGRTATGNQKTAARHQAAGSPMVRWTLHTKGPLMLKYSFLLIPKKLKEHGHPPQAYKTRSADGLSNS